MNTLEFQTWLKEHDAYFPGVDAWVGKQQDRTVEIWMETFGNVSLRAAIEASRAMYEDPDLRPKGWGDHAVTVRRLAHAGGGNVQVPAVRFVDGQQVYECGACLDCARRLVVHPRTMLAIRDGRFKWSQFYTCAVWCGCRYARDLFAAQMTPERRRAGIEFVEYCPRRMVLAEDSPVKNVAAAFGFFNMVAPEVPQHVRATEVTATAADDPKPVATLLPAKMTVAEAQAAEGPWTQENDIPF